MTGAAESASSCCEAVYLHGFASHPESTSKGQHLRQLDVLAVKKMTLPVLEGASFFHCTWESMVREATAAILAASQPVVLLGSSLGGYLAAWLLANKPEVRERVAAAILIAPAFGFPTRWRALLGPEGIEQWRRDGQREFWHFGRQQHEMLGAQFLESVMAVPDLPPWSGVPTAVVHGEADSTVAWEWSWRWYQQRAYIGQQAASDGLGYHLLPDDHSLASPASLATLTAIYRGVADGLMTHKIDDQH